MKCSTCDTRLLARGTALYCPKCEATVTTAPPSPATLAARADKIWEDAFSAYCDGDTKEGSSHERATKVVHDAITKAIEAACPALVEELADLRSQITAAEMYRTEEEELRQQLAVAIRECDEAKLELAKSFEYSDRLYSEGVNLRQALQAERAKGEAEKRHAETCEFHVNRIAKENLILKGKLEAANQRAEKICCVLEEIARGAMAPFDSFQAAYNRGKAAANLALEQHRAASAAEAKQNAPKLSTQAEATD